jgi:hypothetical protein
MRTKMRKIKNHVYNHRAGYTALVTIPTTAITTAVVMDRQYAPYVYIARHMAVFLHDHDLGTKFLEMYKAKAL